MALAACERQLPPVFAKSRVVIVCSPESAGECGAAIYRFGGVVSHFFIVVLLASGVWGNRCATLDWEALSREETGMGKPPGCVVKIAQFHCGYCATLFAKKVGIHTIQILTDGLSLVLCQIAHDPETAFQALSPSLSAMVGPSSQIWASTGTKWVGAWCLRTKASTTSNT